MNDLRFRYEIVPEDVGRVREIVTSTGFFYDFEVEVAAGLVEEKLNEGHECTYMFIFAELKGRPVAYSCYGHIACSEHSYDLYWIVTNDDFRGHGIGKLLLEETHRRIREAGGLNVIAETSTLEKYAPTRHFYLKMGYEERGMIPDFYKSGDGKVTFVRRLSST